MRVGRGGIVWADGLPVALYGVHKEFGTSVHYRVFAFGTDDWKKGAYVVMRELRKLVREVIDEEGTMRMQADSHEDHTEAHQWMEKMGGKRESIMRHYGKNGETYYRYVWLRDEAHLRLDDTWSPWLVKPEQMDIEGIDMSVVTHRDRIQRAKEEVLTQYGDNIRVDTKAKSLLKFGFNPGCWHYLRRCMEPGRH
jgi:hypothetical protein